MPEPGDAFGFLNAILDMKPLAIRASSGSHAIMFFCTLGWVMNMYSLLENNSGLTRELVEQDFDDILFRCTNYRPVLRMFVFWQAHHHSYAVRHGRPHPHPNSTQSSGTRRERTESAKKELCFMSGTTATLSTIVSQDEHARMSALSFATERSGTRARGQF